MKIGIINFHFAHNFGAVLESLALKEYLEKNGHSVLTIDYRPEYLEAQYAPLPNPLAFARWAAKDYSDSSLMYRIYRMIRRMVQALTYYQDAYVRIKRSIAFDAYIERNMILSERYQTISELRNNPPMCDVYISGSDQIWNSKVTAGLDPAYFLDFGTDNIKKVAYAVSPCQLDTYKYENDLKKYLSKYDAVSLRENQYINELNQFCRTQIKKCLDPTLLLDEQDYEKYIEEVQGLPQNYILVYGFVDYQKPTFLNDVVAYVSKSTGMKVIDISIDSKTGVDNSKKLETLTPGQFLFCVKHANCIVTNSFHGTVFSAIYEKPFISVGKSGTESRSKELLEGLNMEKCYLTEFAEERIDNILNTKIDYKKVHCLIEAVRKESMGYLNSNTLEL